MTLTSERGLACGYKINKSEQRLAFGLEKISNKNDNYRKRKYDGEQI